METSAASQSADRCRELVVALSRRLAQSAPGVASQRSGQPAIDRRPNREVLSGGRPSVGVMLAGTLGADDELLSLLDDEHARAILYAAREEAKSVERLADDCGASETTVYRRVQRLEEQDLLETAKQPDPDGHHYTVYATRLDRVEIDLTDEGFVIEVDRREPASAADRFTELYEEFAG
jgi:DNA-binding HxlR family transcriptional regulator